MSDNTLDVVKLRLLATAAANAAFGVLQGAEIDGFGYNWQSRVTFGDANTDVEITADTDGNLTIDERDANGNGRVLELFDDENDDGDDVGVELETMISTGEDGVVTIIETRTETNEDGEVVKTRIQTTLVDVDGNKSVTVTDGAGNVVTDDVDGAVETDTSGQVDGAVAA